MKRIRKMFVDGRDAIHEIIELKSVLRAAIIVELIAGICPLDGIESIRKGASRSIRK